MRKGFFLVGIFITSLWCGQVKDTLLTELVVTSKAPVTKVKLTKKEIQKENLAQDMPFLIERTPSSVATSDAGNGIGYTGIRIRGTDASRVLVTIGGVPINDSESQSVFWVNMPDLASSAGNILIQRGIGSSSNGTSNFGGSIQIQSNRFSKKPSLEFQSVGGSFGTFKNTLLAESGNIANEKLHLRLRLSQLNSDGYVDRASSQLLAYQLEGRFQFSESSEFNFNYLSGKEKTYQAWYGVDEFTLNTDHTFNYAGAIYNHDYSEILGFYENQIDHYQQNHYFTNWKKRWSDQWNSKIIGFYTRGKGYYEELAQFQNPENYKINLDETTDLVRRKWLKNDFYGINSILNYQQNSLKLEGNLALSQYIGNHFGQVINSPFFPLNETVEYYRNRSTKNEFSSYLKGSYNFGNLDAYIDFQIRHINYRAKTPKRGETLIDDNPNFNKSYTFFNPKAGFNWNLNTTKLYTFIGYAHREPTRTDILQNPDIKAEEMLDIELGSNFRSEKLSLSSNLYYMDYKNQLVLSGKLDDVGNAIRENSGKSYRLGWENDLQYSFNSHIELFGNFTLSQNRNKNYTAIIDDEIENLGNTNIAFSPQIVSFFGIQVNAFKVFQFILDNKYVGKQYLNNTENNSILLHDYFLTNFQIIATPKIHFLKTLQLNGKFNNIFGKEYVSNGYDYEGTPYFYPQAGFNFLLGVRMSL